ncbi:MAG TPA: hypothetical protein VNH18_13535 [Bryobacteraceae bacterium]|nr:hypothetical protein [Bryobacteraceae bacterium]
MFALKSVSHDSIAGALAKAERYRLLNEPAAAESICLDILEIEPDNQEALACFILAQTDQIPSDKRAWQQGLAAAGRLAGEYERAYYSGIVWERRAKAFFHESARGSNHSVYEWISRALSYFETAERLRPAGNDDAILRWNTCVRFLKRHPELTPQMDEVPEAILSE